MNKKATALILTIMVSMVLAILGVAYLSLAVNEKNLVQRYKNSARAFWIAEAGLAQGYNQLTADASYSGTACDLDGGDCPQFGGGCYKITISDETGFKKIKAEAKYKGTKEYVSGKLPYIPYPFDNTLSVGGDLNLFAAFAALHVNGKSRYSGEYNEGEFFADADFEDLQYESDQNKTTISLPDYGQDYDQDGDMDEYDNFVLYGQDAAGSYSQDEVVYLQTDDTVNIFPHQDLSGKKIIFVEGSSKGAGDVNIFFDGTWQDNEDLTVISTGDINYIEPLQVSSDSRLNTVSLEDYSESSVFVGYHESVIFANGNADFEDKLEIGYFTGNIIINGNASLEEIFTMEWWDFSQRAKNGDLPPGFELLAGSSGILSSHLRDWQVEYE